jgi:hypothetical protein
METTRGKTREVLAAVDRERASKISEVLTGIETMVKDEVRAKKSEALSYIGELAKVREKNQEKAKSSIVALAQGGYDLGRLSEDQYKTLLNNSGYDPLTFEATFNANKPKAEQVDYKYETIVDESGQTKILAYGVDPTTGQLQTKTYDSGITEGRKPIIVDGIPYYQDPDNPNNLIKATGFVEKPKVGVGGTLTIKEARDLGLPLSLAGRNEADVMAEISSNAPPPWFKEMAQQQAQASLADSALRELWKQFQTGFSATATSEISSGIVNPFD